MRHRVTRSAPDLLPGALRRRVPTVRLYTPYVVLPTGQGLPTLRVGGPPCHLTVLIAVPTGSGGSPPLGALAPAAGRADPRGPDGRAAHGPSAAAAWRPSAVRRVRLPVLRRPGASGLTDRRSRRAGGATYSVARPRPTASGHLLLALSLHRGRAECRLRVLGGAGVG